MITRLDILNQMWEDILEDIGLPEDSYLSYSTGEWKAPADYETKHGSVYVTLRSATEEELELAHALDVVESWYAGEKHDRVVF